MKTTKTHQLVLLLAAGQSMALSASARADNWLNGVGYGIERTLGSCSEFRSLEGGYNSPKQLQINSAAFLPDGRTLVGGVFQYYFEGADQKKSRITNLVMLRSDGAMDCSFNRGGAGIALVSQLDSERVEVGAVTALPNGQLLVGGYFNRYNGIEVPGLVRLNADGSLDPSFDASALSKNPAWTDETKMYSPIEHGVTAMRVDGRGKIWLAGVVGRGAYYYTLMRLNSDGTLDSSFAMNSVPRYQGKWSRAELHAMALDANGGMVIAKDADRSPDIWGSVFESGPVFRVTTNGELDNAFKPGNCVAKMDGYDVAIRPDGKVALAGGSDYKDNLHVAVRRLNGDGSCDASFDNQERISGKPEDGAIYGRNLIPLSDGRYLLAGDFHHISPSGKHAHGVVIVGSDGKIDPRAFHGREFDKAYLGGASHSTQAFLNPLDGSVVFGGYLTQYQGHEVSFGLIKTDTVGNIDRAIRSELPITIGGGRSLVQAGGQRLSWARYRTFNGELVSSLVLLDTNGKMAGILGQLFDGDIKTMDIDSNGQSIWIGGDFKRYGTLDSPYLIHLDLHGRVMDGFASPFTSNYVYKAGIHQLTLEKDGLLLSGSFHFPGDGPDVEPVHLTRLLFGGQQDPGFTPVRKCSDECPHLRLPSGRIFTTTGYSQDHGLTRLLANGQPDPSFELTKDEYIGRFNSFEKFNGGVLVGGAFRLQDRWRVLAFIDENGKALPSFEMGEISQEHEELRSAIPVSGSQFLVSGDFKATDFYGTTTEVYRYNVDGKRDPSFTAKLPDEVGRLIVRQVEVDTQGRYLVSGRLSRQYSSYEGIVRLNSDGSFDSTYLVPSWR